MTRIPDIQFNRNLINYFTRSKEAIDIAQQQVSTGIRVDKPGTDASVAGTISESQQALSRFEGYEKRIGSTRGILDFQDGVLEQSRQVLDRVRELATQASNESFTPDKRSQIGDEVGQLLGQLVSLANSTYQGRYVYSGADDGNPPYTASTFTNPSSGAGSVKYDFTASSGSSVTRSVKITEDLSVTTNTLGNQVFDDSIQAVERLYRSLKGYETGPLAADRSPTGAPDGTGNAYTFPDDYANQTTDIRNALDAVTTAVNTDIVLERSNLGGRLARLNGAQSLVESLKAGVQEVLSRLQDADPVSAASLLAQAQNILQASIRAGASIINNPGLLGSL